MHHRSTCIRRYHVRKEAIRVGCFRSERRYVGFGMSVSSEADRRSSNCHSRTLDQWPLPDKQLQNTARRPQASKDDHPSSAVVLMESRMMQKNYPSNSNRYLNECHNAFHFSSLLRLHASCHCARFLQISTLNINYSTF
jgi:hypothetical protein